MFSRILKPGIAIFDFLEKIINQGLGVRNNWFYYLGAIPILLMLLLLFSGLYLFIYYDLSLNNAYDSVKNVTEASVFGNLMRSLHRYSADGMIFFAILHMVRMFFKRYYQNHRWLAWVSGVMILAFLLIQGVTGYILPLDSTANFVMQETAVLLGSVKIFGNTLSRSFASPGNSGKWIMWIIMIVHLAIPMLILFGIFIHVKRVSRARIFPPKPVIWGTIILMIVFGLLFPVAMLDRADPYKLTYIQEMDWFYLFLIPWMGKGHSLIIWAGFFGAVFFLAIVPWLSKPARIHHAELELSACTGCTLCALDCPYEAIAMRPRSDGLDFKFEAEISKNLCSGCGICIGSCDYDALNLASYSVSQPHQNIRDLLEKNPVKGKNYLGLICKNQAQKAGSIGFSTEDDQLQMLELECVGKFGKSMLDTATRANAAGIIAYSCPDGNCNFREGNIWFEERMNNMRKPKFNRVQNAPPIALVNLNHEKSLIDKTNKVIRKMKLNPTESFKRIISFKKPLSIAVSLFFILVMCFGIYIGSAGASMSIPLDDTKAVVRLDFFYKTDQKACNPEALNPEAYKKAVERVTNRVKMENLTVEARERLIKSARADALNKFCSRERRPLKLRMLLDDELQFTKMFYPSGLQNDGLVYVLHEQVIKPGKYHLKVEISEQDKTGGPEYELIRDFKATTKFFIDFDKNSNRFIGR